MFEGKEGTSLKQKSIEPKLRESVPKPANNDDLIDAESENAYEDASENAQEVYRLYSNK